MAHRRHDPLRDEWVLVSPGRSSRPWQGEESDVIGPERPRYDPDCYLCPGNERAGGQMNADYDGPYVFENDFPALSATSEHTSGETGVLRSQSVAGRCDVVCYSPRHDRSLGDLSVAERRAVIDTWADLTTTLLEQFAVVQVFENRGSMMGASNPHPHGQVWSLDQLPTVVAKEQASQSQYVAEHGRPLLVDALDAEREAGARVLKSSDHWTTVVPYWAVWPFETLVIPHRPVGLLSEVADDERDDLAGILGLLIETYDNLFGTPFPYSMGIHQAPHGASSGWVLHVHFHPPLLRSATVKKHMVGFEMFGEPQRDLTPEQAAEALRGAAEENVFA